MVTKFEFYDTGDSAKSPVYGADRAAAQTFTPSSSHTITKVILKIYKVGTVAGNVIASIRATSSGEPTGSDLTSGSIIANDVQPAVNNWEEIVFDTPYALSAGTMYAIVLKAPDAGVDEIYWKLDNISPSYSGGTYWVFYVPVGWQQDTDIDFLFEEWGNPAYPTDAITRVTGVTKLHERTAGQAHNYIMMLQLGGLANLLGLEDVFQMIADEQVIKRATPEAISKYLDRLKAMGILRGIPTGTLRGQPLDGATKASLYQEALEKYNPFLAMERQRRLDIRKANAPPDTPWQKRKGT